MALLDNLPSVDSFFGTDLKTGSIIVASMGILHPVAYGCSCFLHMSYLLVTIWILVALYFVASILLLHGLVRDDVMLCSVWVWYAMIFVILMMIMMTLLALVFTSRKQPSRVFVVILGILWYILSIYFILVVNSHRKELGGQSSKKSHYLLR